MHIEIVEHKQIKIDGPYISQFCIFSYEIALALYFSTQIVLSKTI